MFLNGLNPNLDELKGRIFRRKPLLNLREVFLEVKGEEGRRHVMLNNNSTLTISNLKSWLWWLRAMRMKLSEETTRMVKKSCGMIIARSHGIRERRARKFMENHQTGRRDQEIKSGLSS